MKRLSLSREILLITFTFLGQGFMYVCFIRMFTHEHCFFGMSKTRKRKILRSQSRFSYFFMTYAPKYNNPKRTWLCVICYYLHLICLIGSIGLIWFNVLVMEIRKPPRIFVVILYYMIYAPIIPIISSKTLKKARKKKK